MPPVKFDDLQKVAEEVMKDDYQTSGYQLKAKQKTSFDGAIITTAVDLFPEKDSCMTPGKLTWKFPKPLGCTFFSIDKLEMDKKGGLKLEAISDKVYDGLKVKCTSDLANIEKVTVGATYTGLKDTQVIVDTKATNPQDFTCEVTRTQGLATFGMKCTAATLTTPDVGVRVASGPMFAALTGKEKFAAWNVACHYKASKDLRCAAQYTHGGKQNGNFAVGVAYQLKQGLSMKAKVTQDMNVSTSVKNTISKGFTVIGGASYTPSSGKQSVGLQLSIE